MTAYVATDDLDQFSFEHNCRVAHAWRYTLYSTNASSGLSRPLASTSIALRIYNKSTTIHNRSKQVEFELMTARHFHAANHVVSDTAVAFFVHGGAMHC